MPRISLKDLVSAILSAHSFLLNVHVPRSLPQTLDYLNMSHATSLAKKMANMVASNRFSIFHDDDCDDLSRKRHNHEIVGLNYADPDELEEPNLRRIRRQRLQGIKFMFIIIIYF